MRSGGGVWELKSITPEIHVRINEQSKALQSMSMSTELILSACFSRHESNNLFDYITI